MVNRGFCDTNAVILLVSLRLPHLTHALSLGLTLEDDPKTVGIGGGLPPHEREIRLTIIYCPVQSPSSLYKGLAASPDACHTASNAGHSN